MGLIKKSHWGNRLDNLHNIGFLWIPQLIEYLLTRTKSHDGYPTYLWQRGISSVSHHCYNFYRKCQMAMDSWYILTQFETPSASVIQKVIVPGHRWELLLSLNWNGNKPEPGNCKNQWSKLHIGLCLIFRLRVKILHLRSVLRVGWNFNNLFFFMLHVKCRKIVFFSIFNWDQCVWSFNWVDI